MQHKDKRNSRTSRRTSAILKAVRTTTFRMRVCVDATKYNRKKDTLKGDGVIDYE